MAPLKREVVIEPMDASMLSPLVDLAYWSKFVEVRRDAASAIAALAMNKDNLKIMAEAGALGAVMALLGSSDAECLQSATLALSRLVTRNDVADRFLSAPGGLDAVFRLAARASKTIRKHALRVVLHVAASSASASEAILERGAMRAVAPLLVHESADARLAAGDILGTIARVVPRKALLATDAEMLELGLRTLRREFADTDDALEANLVDFFAAVASVPELRQKLVHAPFLHKLRTQYLPLKTVVKLLHCVGHLVAEPANRRPLLDEHSLLRTISKLVFVDVPGRFGLASLSVLGPLEVAADDDPNDESVVFRVDDEAMEATPKNWERRASELLFRAPDDDAAIRASIAMPNSPPQLLVRHCVGILCELAQDPGCRERVVDGDLLTHVLSTAFSTFRRDRRVCRTASVALERIAAGVAHTADPLRYARSLRKQGLAVAVEAQLAGDDNVQRRNAVRTLAAVILRLRGDDAFDFLEKPAILRELVALAFMPDAREAVARVLSVAVASYPSAAYTLSAHLGALEVLASMTASSWRQHNPDYVADLVKTLACLAVHATDDQRRALVESFAMTLVFRIAKHPAHQAYPQATDLLRTLGHEVATHRVTTALATFVSKMRDPAFRDTFRRTRDALVA